VPLVYFKELTSNIFTTNSAMGAEQIGEHIWVRKIRDF
jgi:hypothetical protein